MARKPLTQRAPLDPVEPSRDRCLELEDHSQRVWSTTKLFALEPRDHSNAARLADQFVRQNLKLLAALNVGVDRAYDGREVSLILNAGNAVGAIPLVSPTSARLDYGLVVKPRFPWKGIGPMLAEMGWRISPTALRLPLLKRSERRVPAWVLSHMILSRLKALLDSIDRRFEVVHEHPSAPRGTVYWGEYATRKLPSAQFLSVPCSFPDLRDDRVLKGAIRHTALRQLRSLETQREHGAFVARLMALAEEVLQRVSGVPEHVPGISTMQSWVQRPLRSSPFLEGIQAIEWTVEERGLAGISDLEGIPWRMPMDEFFESWVETIFQLVARTIGARLKVGRKNETVHAIRWNPPFLGSQKALIPDLWLESDRGIVVVDAKYKRHCEEMQRQDWRHAGDELKDQHRHDLLQVLAYSGLAAGKSVMAWLLYPCAADNWQRLAERGRLFQRAELVLGSRVVQIRLSAAPMGMDAQKVADAFVAELRAGDYSTR